MNRLRDSFVSMAPRKKSGATLSPLRKHRTVLKWKIVKLLWTEISTAGNNRLIPRVDGSRGSAGWRKGTWMCSKLTVLPKEKMVVSKSNIKAQPSIQPSTHWPDQDSESIYSKAAGNSKPDPVLDGFWTQKELEKLGSLTPGSKWNMIAKSQKASWCWSLDFCLCGLNNVCVCVCVCLILGNCELVLAAADGFNEIWPCRINKHHLVLVVSFFECHVQKKHRSLSKCSRTSLSIPGSRF